MLKLNEIDFVRTHFEINKPNFNCYVHTTAACIIYPFSKYKQIRASRLGTDLSDISESILIGDSDNVVVNDELSITQSPKGNGKLNKTKRSIWKRRRVRGVDKEAKNDKVSDVGVSESDMSVRRCNAILETVDDGQALQHFEWMRKNDKLKQNLTAYKLVLRVLGRRQDWDGAEKMIRGMMSESGCELNCQVFNTLIYACRQQGLAEVAAKWFCMMVEDGVQPNIATFDMLMSLYQKGRVVEEAEFTFSAMRDFKIKCENAYSAMITIYTRLGWYDKAEQVIGFLKEDEIVLNKENWLVLINAYCQQGKLQKAELVFDSMLEAGFPPHIVAYNTMITGYGKILNMDAAQCLFCNLEKVGLEPNETTYRSMLEGWGRVDNYKEAASYYDKLISSGFKPNSTNLHTMINLQAKHEDKEGAVRTLNEMIKMGCQYSSLLGVLVRAYEKSGNFDNVPSVLTGSFYEHILNNHMSCSILVMAYVKHGLVTDAIKVLQGKTWEDPFFEDNLYHLLICSCKELGRPENAVQIYTSMPNSSKPNLHILSTMIDIYTLMGLFEEAENVYLKLKSSGIMLDVIAFSIVVKMYVKSGSLKDACSVLDTMDKRKDIVPDVYLLRDMLRIYQRLSMLDKLSDLYYKILKSGIPLDQDMYNCLINCCARALPVDELSSVFDEMLERGFEPNTITVNTMLDVYGKSKLFKKLKRVFWMAKKRGLVDTVSYNTIIAAYGQSKDLQNMSSAVQEMQFSGFSVSLEAYNCMLDAYGKEGEMEKFRDVLQRLKESSCGSDHYTYNTIINIYGEKGWIEDVGGVLTELKESGLGPDLCSYNTLIKAYGIAGMVEEAVGVIKEMRDNGLEPDMATYANLIAALQKNDKYLEAVRWSLWMKQMGL